MQKIMTICDYVLQMPGRGPNVAIDTKQKGQWQKLTWLEYYELIEKVFHGLSEVGLKPNENIALMSNTRMEWSVADLAILCSRAVTVPIYQTSTAEDLEFILNNCQAKILILENIHLFHLFQKVQARCPLIEKVICIDPTSENHDLLISWTEIMAFGEQRRQMNASAFAESCKSVEIDDVASILYTSGTTGQPKGVVLTHQQIISEVCEAFPLAGANEQDQLLGFLPYAHILGRVEHWGQAIVGYRLAFAESIESLRTDLREIRPTLMVCVPRIFEKVYAAIWAQAESNIATAKIFRWGVSVGLKAGQYRLKREPLPLHLVVQHEMAKSLVLNKVKEAFGGRLRFAISGGAPLAKEIALFFHACDVLILEGYGLTETTAAICVNVPFDYRFGSVGKPIGDVQIRIAEDGEILVKSKKVMREYYKNPQATAESLKEGWFYTGDIGEILPSGDLRITDRKKDLIKTAGGKYVAPQRLEGLLKNHNLISHALIHGDQKKYIVALLTLDKPALLKFASEQGLENSDYAELTQHPKVLEFLRQCVAETNTHLASFETIKRFTILKKDFTIEDGELTPSMKIKRKLLDKKFKKQIDALYK